MEKKAIYILQGLTKGVSVLNEVHLSNICIAVGNLGATLVGGPFGR